MFDTSTASTNMADGCIIHKGDVASRTSGTLHLLTETAWTKILEAAESRKRTTNYFSASYKPVIDCLPAHKPTEAYYHSSCYKNFTAVRKTSTSTQLPLETAASSCPSTPLTLRSNTERLKTSRSGVLEKKCIWCNNARCKVKQTCQPLTQAMACNQETIKYYINLSGTENLIKELGHEDVDFVAKEVQYHLQCKKDFIRQVEKKQRECHATPTEDAYAKLYGMIQLEIVENRRVLSASSMYEQFIMYSRNGNDAVDKCEVLVQ